MFTNGNFLLPLVLGEIQTFREKKNPKVKSQGLYIEEFKNIKLSVVTNLIQHIYIDL